MPESYSFGAFDFGLSESQEARARGLHDESIIIDMMYYGPCGYRCFTDEMVKELQNEWEHTRDGWLAFTSAYLMPIRYALDGRSDELENHWRATAITGGNREVPLDFIEAPIGDTIRTVAATVAHFDRLSWTIKALRASDFRRAKAERRFAGYMNAQMTAGLLRPEVLMVVHDLGLRMLMLTYNKQNFLGSGCLESTDTGLSDLGRTFVRRMNELGIIVDTAHCGRQTTLDVCAASAMPVAATHLGAAASYRHPRNKDDEQLRAIASTGGIIGICALPAFLGPGNELTIDVMLDHIEHAVSLVGWRHVGVGTDHPLMSPKWTIEETAWSYHEKLGFRPDDMGDMTVNLNGFDDYRDFINITRGLVKRGFSDEQVKGILGGNFLRVFEAVCG